MNAATVGASEDHPYGPPRPIDRVWVMLPLLLPAIVGLLAHLSTTDLAYHLRLGEVTISQSSVAMVDTFTFTVNGSEWVNQQWGAQVLLALVFRAGGWPTLGVLQAMLIGISFWMVFRAALARGASTALASGAAVAGFLVAAPNLSLRPQLLALPLVTLCVWILARRHERPTLLWVLPVSSFMLANLHGSYVLIPALIALGWLEDTFERAPGRSRLALWGGASVLASFVNPYGAGVWAYVLDLANDPTIRTAITEWAPVSLSTASGWLMIGSAAGTGWILARADSPTPWAPLVTLTVFFGMAMMSQRATLWWAVVAPVTIARLVPIRRSGASAAEGGSVVPAAVIVAALGIISLLSLPWWRSDAYVAGMRDAPAGVARTLAGLPEGARVFAHQPWASWLEQEAPNVLVFVDSRIELFPEEVWLDYGQVAFAGARWHEVLDRWEPDAIAADASWDLLPFLRADPAWRVVHEDDDGAIFVRS